jgi:hypothetical protein
VIRPHDEKSEGRARACRAITDLSVIDVPVRLLFAPLAGFEDLGYSAARLGSRLRGFTDSPRWRLPC